MNYMIQCRLRRQEEGSVGDTYLTTWIPEKFAKIGNVLKMRHANDRTWEDGWVVVDKGAKREENHVFDHERDFMKQRKASDI